jgi:nitrogen regulatory protein PII
MDAAQVKVVTVILPSGLSAELINELKKLGVSGFTTLRANGYGSHGSRRYGLTDGANERIETIVSAATATKIFEYLSSHYDGLPFVAYAQDALAIPRSHFGEHASH